MERIQNWPCPVTKKQVKSYLGLISYYQKFIKDFSTVAAPLYNLTSSRLPNHVRWTNEAERAFQTLKQALCEEPVLVSPDFDKPFVLQTDASGTGIGAVLAQIIEGDEHPITYISRKLLKHERNYSTVEKECLAIKWAIHHLRYYLWGRKFVLVTDHAPLKWMATSKDKNARVTRWFLDLQNYNFTVEHRPGKAIQNADAMSRMFEEEEAEAPDPGGELRGGKCGVSLWARPDRRPPRGKWRPLTLGRVIEGRYIPRYLLNQSEMMTAVSAYASDDTCALISRGLKLRPTCPVRGSYSWVRDASSGGKLHTHSTVS